MLANALDKLNLLFRGETSDYCFNNTAKRYLVHRNEAVVVHVCEESHDELTVHTISDTAVTWDGITKVLDLECALKSRCKESSERCD